MTTTRTLITAEELLAMPDDKHRYELVKGELRKMPPAGSEHGVITSRFNAAVFQFVDTNNLGIVFGAETGFRISSNPDTVRAPDLAFIRRERIPEGGVPKGYWPGPPDLAVEVVSPNDTYAEVEEKVVDWLNAGTRMVIVINPRVRAVTIYHSQTEVARLTESAALSGHDTLPGFEYPVSKLFEGLS